MFLSFSILVQTINWLEAVLSPSSIQESMLPIPSSLSWYCNAPHSALENYTLPIQLTLNNANHHPSPKSDYKLVHVVHIQRHSKRTPVNLLPNEQFYNPPSGWQCDQMEYFTYAKGDQLGGTNIQKQFQIPDWHPLKSRFWNGTCESGPLTTSGLRQSIQHGKDFWSIYSPESGKNPIDGMKSIKFPSKQETYLRTSPEERTFQVAAGFLHGMGVPSDHTIESTVMPSTLDDMAPSYTCTHANDLRNQINSEQEWTNHLKNQSNLFQSLNDVLGTTNNSGWNSWIDHPFDALSSRQCHGHPLPTNPTTGKSISQDIADQVYSEGNWEYNYIWNASPNADEYTKYSIAVLVKELAVLLQNIKDGNKDKKKVSLFIGHDGTMVRLYKTFGMPNILWPGLGSELNFEIYKSKKDSKYFVRILSYGQTFQSTIKALTTSGGNSSHESDYDYVTDEQQQQIGQISWTPLENIIDYLNTRVPNDLLDKCS